MALVFYAMTLRISYLISQFPRQEINRLCVYASAVRGLCLIGITNPRGFSSCGRFSGFVSGYVFLLSDRL